MVREGKGQWLKGSPRDCVPWHRNRSCCDVFLVILQSIYCTYRIA